MNETKTGSYGLNNIKERVAGIGGTVKSLVLKGKVRAWRSRSL